MKIVYNKKNLLVAAFVIILFIRSFALRESQTLGSEGIKKLLAMLTWLSMGYISFTQIKKTRITQDKIALIIAVAFYFIYKILRPYKFYGLDITNALVCILLLLQTEEIKSSIFCAFKKIIVLESVAGIIIYLIHVLPFVGLPHTVVPRLMGSETSYANYFFSLILLDMNGEVRLCGLFDEPGYFAAFLAFFLCADDLKLKKKENIALLIAGALTFSLGFFFLIIVYFVLKNIKEFKRWLPLLMAIIVIFFVLPNFRTGNVHVDHTITRLSRLLSSGGGLSMNGSRYDAKFSEVVENLKSDFQLLLIGYGSGYVESFKEINNTAAESFVKYIVDFGIIGTMLIFVPELLILLKMYRNNYLVVSYIIVTIANLFQRPYFYTISYFMMFICGVAYIGIKQARDEEVKKIDSNNYVCRRYIVSRME